MIVGVTGYFCSGKDTMAALLEARSFAHISLSDMIREELRRRGLPITIPNLTEVGNEMRREGGPGVLARIALARIDHSRNWVVTSIRHPAEVEALRARPDFVMVFVEASQRVRYERSVTRARSGDPVSFEEFVAEERRQLRAAGGDPAAQQLEACRKLANERLTNNGTREAFEEKVSQFVSRALPKYCLPRPGWDEYFMMIAEVAASRGNCLKRRIGAVVVSNNQILSTGYNGTPRGIKNCSEGGCPRCAGAARTGKSLDECLCVHAEENALLQAAAHGTAIRGATLYTTFCPCSYCAKSIINAGIKQVVFREAYAMDEITHRLFKEAGVVMRNINEVPEIIAPSYQKSPPTERREKAAAKRRKSAGR